VEEHVLLIIQAQKQYPREYMHEDARYKSKASAAGVQHRDARCHWLRGNLALSATSSQHANKAYANAMDGGNPWKCHVLYKRESYNSVINTSPGVFPRMQVKLAHKYHQEVFLHMQVKISRYICRKTSTSPSSFLIVCLIPRFVLSHLSRFHLSP